MAAQRRNGRALTREDLYESIEGLKELVQEKIGRTSDAVETLASEFQAFRQSNRDTIERLERRDQEIDDKADAMSDRWKLVGGIGAGVGGAIGFFLNWISGK